MPWPTNPSEEYFGRGLWGWVTTAWVKLLATAGGALHVYVKGGDSAILVKQQQAALLTPGIHGYDGAAWRKLQLLFGYTDRWAEDLGGTKSGDGTYSATTTVVPAGYVYVLQNLVMVNITGSRGLGQIYVHDGSGVFTIDQIVNTVQYQLLIWRGAMVLKAGDKCGIYAVSCLNGDVIEGGAWGYKMAVT